MPKYIYVCSICAAESVFYHSMSEKKTDCLSCEGINVLVKRPSNFSLDRQKKDRKVGDLVKETIEETRQEVEQEKEKIRNEFYDPNK